MAHLAPTKWDARYGFFPVVFSVTCRPVLKKFAIGTSVLFLMMLRTMQNVCSVVRWLVVPPTPVSLLSMSPNVTCRYVYKDLHSHNTNPTIDTVS